MVMHLRSRTEEAALADASAESMVGCLNCALGPVLSICVLCSSQIVLRFSGQIFS